MSDWLLPPDELAEPDPATCDAFDDLSVQRAAEEYERHRRNGHDENWVREPPDDYPSEPVSEDEFAPSWAEVDLTGVVAGLKDGSLRPPEPTLCRLSNGIGLFYAGRVNSLFGDPNAGKSWVAQLACRQEIESGRHVLFLDFEDSRVLTVGRLLALGADPAAVVERFHYVSPDEPFGTFARERVEALLARYDPSWVVIDSTGESMALDNIKTNLDEDVSRWNRNLPRWIARHGPGVGLLDHVPKDPTNRAGPSGSHRKKAMVTGSSFYLEAIKEFGIGQCGVARLTTAKDRCGFYVRNKVAATFTVDARLERGATAIDQPYVVSLEPPEPSSQEPKGGKRPTWLMEAASKVIEETPGLSRNAVAAAVGKNRQFTLLAIEFLVAEGYVDLQPGPNRAQLHHSIRPYRQDTDPKLTPARSADDEMEDF